MQLDPHPIHEGAPRPPARPNKLAVPDRLALLALVGVTASVGMWLLLSWADSTLRATPLQEELFTPTPQQQVVRLAAIVAVLTATLLVQALTARRLRAEQRYRQLVEHSPDMVLVHRAGRVTFVNAAGARLLGVESPKDALHAPVANLLAPAEDVAGFTRLLASVASGDLPRPTPVKLRRPDGGLVDVELSARRLEGDGRDEVQCVARDISERVAAQRAIERMAFHDPLTDLPNRALFRDRLDTALSQARRRGETVAVVFVDLDDFKAVNDTFGHAVGDGLLMAVAKRLRSLLREEDTVARHGGDEFTVIARLARREDGVTLAERILASLVERFEVEGHRLRVSACVGIATYPEDGEAEIELIRNADTAMYHAKECGHNIARMYTPALSESATGRLELEAAMREGIERRQFELFYQPEVDVRDGRVVGIEALLRWNHPTRGLLGPCEFIEFAERAGLIGELGEWALRSACLQARDWIAEGIAFGHVAVNLSPKQFMQRDMAVCVAHALDLSGLPANRLEVELTESIAMYGTEEILAALNSVRELGVRIALDDFGTGYSSMSYLKRFPIQTLKIAQDFMRDVDEDEQSAAIASMLIDLSRRLGFDIIAEGVERQSQLDFLEGADCFVIQGYLCSRPAPADAIAELLRAGIPLRRRAEVTPPRLTPVTSLLADPAHA